MLSPEEIELSLLAPRLPLSFLLELHNRDVNRKGSNLPDSAIFYRLWVLFDCLREPDVVAALDEEQKAADADFRAAMQSLRWRVVSIDPDIKQLEQEDLEPLKPAGRRLFDALSNADC